MPHAATSCSAGLETHQFTIDQGMVSLFCHRVFSHVQKNEAASSHRQLVIKLVLPQDIGHSVSAYASHVCSPEPLADVSGPDAEVSKGLAQQPFALLGSPEVGNHAQKASGGNTSSRKDLIQVYIPMCYAAH